MNRRCKNCDVSLKVFSQRDGRWLCEDCCHVGKWAMLVGGLVVGMITALIKVFS